MMVRIVILLYTMACWSSTSSCDKLLKESAYDDEQFAGDVSGDSFMKISKHNDYETYYDNPYAHKKKISKHDDEAYYDNPYAHKRRHGKRRAARNESIEEDTISAIRTLYPYKTTLNAVKREINVSNQFPVRSNRFKEFIVLSDVFVDKSLLIKEIIECKDKLMIINCPRKWGKSMNLNMIKNFFEIEVDRNGNEHFPKKKTFNYKLFNQRTIRTGEAVLKLQKPFLISQYPDIINIYQGRYPVIYVNLANITGVTYEDVFNVCKSRIARTFTRHRYMIGVLRDGRETQPTLVPYREQIWRKFCKYAMNGQIAEAELEESLLFLSNILYEHFGRRVFILIDEFDRPITQMVHGSYFKIRDEQKLLKFYESLMRNTFARNEHLEKGILTGQLRLGGRQHPYNSYKGVFEFLNSSIAEYFGFTKREVQELFDYYNIPTELANQAFQWYDGYHTFDNDEPMFNPYMITKFLYSKTIKLYWEKPSENLYITKILDVRPIRGMIETLVVDNNISLHLTDSVHTANLIRLKMILQRDNIDSLDHNTVTLQVSYLRFIGYLTWRSIDYNDTRFVHYVQLRIPNNEIREEFMLRLRIYYARRDHILPKAMEALSSSMHNFIVSNVSTVDLITALWNFYEALPIFLQTASRFKPYTTNGQLLQSIRNYLSIRMYKQYGYEVQIQRKIASNPDMLFFKNGTAVIFKLHYDSRSSEYALMEAKTYITLVQHRTDIKTVKLIGIAITLSKDIYVDTETIRLTHTNIK